MSGETPRLRFNGVPIVPDDGETIRVPRMYHEAFVKMIERVCGDTGKLRPVYMPAPDKAAP